MSGRRPAPWVLLGAVVFCAVLRLPGLFTGFQTDDYQLLATLHGQFVLARQPWDLFWFAQRSPEEFRALLDFGFNPWWTSPEHRLAMFRPLSSLLWWLDDQLLGADALAAHLHSLLWWLALLGAVAALYLRLLPPVAAAAAFVLFALDESHNTPLAWLANRSTLVAATFGVLALLAHLRARELAAAAPRAAWLGLSCALWALALAAGEYALGLLAYALACELIGARGSPLGRAMRLAPAAALALAYLALRAAAGYGAASSGLYVTPAQPLAYAQVAFGRVAALASELLLGVPSSWFQSAPPLRGAVFSLGLFSPDAWQKLPDWTSWQIALGAGALVAAALLLRKLRRDAGPELAAVSWLAFGSLLALPLAASALPGSRLLAAPAIGSCALIAAALVHALPRARGNWPAMLLCGAAIAVHGALAAQRAHADADRLRAQAEAARRWSLAAEIPADAAATDVVIVSASDFTTAVHLPWLRLQHGRALPRSYRRLSGALLPHELVRIDAHTIELRVLGGDARDAFAGSLYRARDEPLAAGQRVRLRGMEVRVLAVHAGNPQRLRVRFDRPLEDPQLLFLHARPEGLRRLRLPALGERMLLPLAAVPPR
jgi:hypothetical protein